MVCRPPVTSLSWHRDVIYSYYCSQLSHGVFGSELRSLGLCITLALSSLCSQSQPCTHETSPALASQGRGLPALGNTSGLVSHYTLCYGSGAAALITGHGILELWRLRCEWEIPLTGLSFSVWRGLGGVTLLKEDPLCGQALRVLRPHCRSNSFCLWWRMRSFSLLFCLSCLLASMLLPVMGLSGTKPE
jgi:hypothetical protein